MSGWFHYLRRIPIRRPLIFGTCFSGAKSGIADALVQTKVEHADELDWRRVGIFTTFGACFSGAWQYGLFVKLMPRLLPNAASFAAKPLRAKLRDAPGLRTLGAQLAIENGINNPLLFFPVFYTLKELIEEGDVDILAAAKRGLGVYSENWKEDVLAAWKVWVPAQLINFAFSPMWFRVPFVACVSFGWMVFVSFARGKPSAGRLDLDAAGEPPVTLTAEQIALASAYVADETARVLRAQARRAEERRAAEQEAVAERSRMIRTVSRV